MPPQHACLEFMRQLVSCGNTAMTPAEQTGPEPRAHQCSRLALPRYRRAPLGHDEALLAVLQLQAVVLRVHNPDLRVWDRRA